MRACCARSISPTTRWRSTTRWWSSDRPGSTSCCPTPPGTTPPTRNAARRHRVRRLADRDLRPVGRPGPPGADPHLRLGPVHAGRRPELHRSPRPGASRPGRDRDRRQLRAGRLAQGRVRRRARTPGTNVFDHDLDTVAQHPGIQARQQGVAGLCEQCQQCPVVTSCGGGLYTHRYRSGNGFNNPSAYCADLLKLITHIDSHRPVAAVGLPGIPAHALAAADLAALAAGGGGAVVTQLAGAQQSLLRAMLGSVYQAASTGAGA